MMTEVRSTLITTDIRERRIFQSDPKGYTAHDEALMFNLDLPASSNLEAVGVDDGYAKDADSYVSVFLRLSLPEGCKASYAMHHIGYLR